MKPTHVLVCLTHTFPFISTEFFDLMIAATTKYKLSIKRSNVLPIDFNRTQLTKLGLKDSSITHFLFIDTDIIPERTDFIDYMVSYDLPILGLLCTKKTHPYEPILVKASAPDSEKIGPFWVKFPIGLVEVDYTGTGCLMVKREVFEKLTPPYFKFMCEYGTDGNDASSGEDIYFLSKAKAYQYPVYVDTSVTCTHIGTYGFGLKDFYTATKK